MFDPCALDDWNLARVIALTLDGYTFYGTPEAARERRAEIIERYLRRATEKARAAGYAEAKAAATALFSAFVIEAEGRKEEYPDVIPIEINTAKWFARRIQELAPATTKEP